MALSKNDRVAFEFTVLGATHRGTGTVSSDELNYACWPPGRTVRVETSNGGYEPGQHIAVCTHNIRRIA